MSLWHLIHELLFLFPMMETAPQADDARSSSLSRSQLWGKHHPLPQLPHVIEAKFLLIVAKRSRGPFFI